MEGLTGSYSTQDWAQLIKDWSITLYIISPITGEPLDMPSVTLPDSGYKENDELAEGYRAIAAENYRLAEDSLPVALEEWPEWDG